MRPSSNTCEVFSDRIKQLRQAKGLTQSEFGALLNVSKNYVYMLEKGRTPGKKIVELVRQLEGGSETRLLRDVPGEYRVSQNVTTGRTEIDFIPGMETEFLLPLLVRARAVRDVDLVISISLELSRRKKLEDEKPKSGGPP
jgi:transcriptional regulator with XRE-family HTH domain